MKRPVIVGRSRLLQQTRQSPSQTEGEPHSNYPRATSNTSPIAKQMLILLFLASALLIATRIGCLFGLESHEFDGFKADLNVFNNENNWEKSGLSNNQYRFYCAVLSPPTDSTGNTCCATYASVLNYGATGIGLTVTNKIGFDLISVSRITTVTTTIINENQNEMIFNGGPLWGQQTQTQVHHPIAPEFNGHDRIDSIGVGLVEFTDMGCIFNNSTDRIGLQYDMLSGMFFLFLLSFFNCFVVKCYVLVSFFFFATF